ncbi:hypothetical protein [Ruegeria atlantica]|uniref:hypothetical protein n=1 Tax=Ruegeria atlantica TaxID=81569 RepID=UPI000A742FA8|nr:hypothetical protein [Ruegeria atlantica]
MDALSAEALKDARQEAEKWRTVAHQGKDPIKDLERIRREAAKADHTLTMVAKETFRK